MRLLHIPPDPRAPDPTQSEAWRTYTTTWGRETALLALSALVEPLVVRDLAPQEWLDREHVERLSDLRGSVVPILRNPRALIDAEALLREGLAGTSGRYVGLRSWEQIWRRYVQDGLYIPSVRDRLEPVGWLTLPVDWKAATRHSVYHVDRGEHLWSCARQILGGPEWIVDLYRTGLGLWCWHLDAEVPEWVLIVRPGDGLPWPEAAAFQPQSYSAKPTGETQTAPDETGAGVTT